MSICILVISQFIIGDVIGDRDEVSETFWNEMISENLRYQRVFGMLICVNISLSTFRTNCRRFLTGAAMDTRPAKKPRLQSVLANTDKDAALMPVHSLVVASQVSHQPQS